MATVPVPSAASKPPTTAQVVGPEGHVGAGAEDPGGVAGTAGRPGRCSAGVEDAALQTLVEGGVALHPLLRQRVQLARGDHPGDAADPVVVGERVDQPFQPPRVDQHVVVGEGDQLGVSTCGRAGVVGPGQPGPVLADVAQPRLGARPARATSSAVRVGRRARCPPPRAAPGAGVPAKTERRHSASRSGRSRVATTTVASAAPGVRRRTVAGR